MKYLILGNGWIGNRINGYLKDSVISDIRIRKAEDVVQEINKYNANYVISCIGRTGMPNIDWCENNKEETLYMNTIIPGMIQKACSFTNSKMINLGTGCIYDGDKFYTEEEEPNFINSYYSKTKFLAEKMLQDYNDLQLRIRMPIDNVPHKRNFLDKILLYENLISVRNSVTIIPTFLPMMEKLIDRKEIGIFNCVHSYPVEHKEIINIYNQFSDVKKEFNLITSEQLDKITLAKRSNCTLSTKKLEKVGIFSKPEDLVNCIEQYVNSEIPCVV